MKILTLLWSLLLLAAPVAAQPSWDHDYRDVDSLLKRHVDSKGSVNYATLSQDAALGDFLQRIGALSPEEVGSWTRPQKEAFYINAYNNYW